MGHPEVAAPLLVFTAAIPFISGMYVLVYALRPRLNMKYEVYVTSVIEPITVLLTGAALFSWHRSIAMAAWAHVSAALLAFVAAVVAFQRVYPRTADRKSTRLNYSQ